MTPFHILQEGIIDDRPPFVGCERKLWSVTSGIPLYAREFELMIYRLSALFPHKSRCQIAAMTPVPDLVQVSKLDTQFHSDPEYIQHVQYVSGSTPTQRRVRKEERWKRERALGSGGSGIVWLERCIQGDSEGKVRAVKKIQKCSNYYRELEAIALFSHSKVSLLLLSIQNPLFHTSR